ncbi:cupin domain-containing protein [Granulicella sp. dw_53]|uniref:cupin domain-containing protein n=1 Tax=Granulicella sp. dw_53 TaxID=2719792 RepID=UPI001BD34CBE|nr:cupin domain-containing protein [Granulicella sp. dw_53]
MRRAKLAPLTTSALILLSSAFTVAQNAPLSSGTKNAINGIDSYPSPGLVRYAKANDPQTHLIDMFLSDWQGSMPRSEHGSLVLRDILTKGDNFAPPQKGAVLNYANSLSLGRLAAGASTTPSPLAKQQEIFYILSGEGEIASAGETTKLHPNIAVFVPAGVEFVMKSGADHPLTLYVINEPIADGFHPSSKMIIRDQSTARQRTPAGGDPYIVGGASGHWAHVVKELFSPADGLAAIQSVITVTINPGTLGEPHPHKPAQEEVWAAIEGDSLIMLGTQLRVQHPGMAYMPRPDGTMVHSNINPGDKPVTFLYFARFPENTNYVHATDR